MTGSSMLGAAEGLGGIDGIRAVRAAARRRVGVPRPPMVWFDSPLQAAIAFVYLGADRTDPRCRALVGLHLSTRGIVVTMP